MSTISAGTTSTTALVSSGDTTGNLVFQTNGTTTAMTIDTSQNVGIGTSSPLDKLNVSASSSGGVGGVISAANAAAAAVGNESVVGFRSASQFGTTYYSGKIRSIVRNASTYLSDLAFNVYDASGPDGKEAMRIDSSGNVGIGTTAPSGYGILTLSKTGTVTLGFESKNAWDASINVDATGNMRFHNPAATERIRIDASGNLLIGTASVGGNGLSIQPAVSAGGTQLLFNRANTTGTSFVLDFRNNGTTVGYISHTNTGTTYSTTSDYRLKDNPQPLTNSGAFIDALKPKTWQWKVDGSRGVGFIAHEVQEVSPSSVVGEKDAVNEDGSIKVQAMEYGSAEFIANIVAELQSLRARIAVLEAK